MAIFQIFGNHRISLFIRNAVFYTVAIFVSVSCEYNMELDKYEQPPKLFLDCIAGFNDSTVVKVMAATPINKLPGEFDVEKVNLRMTVNGKAVDLSKKHTPMYRNLYWYSDVRYKPGDKVVIDASLDGITPIHAETVIPTESPQATVKVFGQSEDLQDIYVSLKFDSGKTRYYAMRVFQTVRYYNPIIERDVSNTQQMFYLNDKVNYINDHNNRDCILFWDTTEYDSGEFDVKLSTYSQIVNTTGVKSVEYNVMLYNMTEEYFKYLLSLTRNDNGSSTGSDFLYNTMSAYTNVDNGLGILAGVNTIKSNALHDGDVMEIR